MGKNNKKKIIVFMMIILITTGCTCEYNLKIENDSLKEQVILISETTNEKNSFTNKWQIPIYKEDFNIGLDPDNSNLDNTNIYNYKLTNDKLTFDNTFAVSNYYNSTAASICYNQVSINDDYNNLVISTSPNATCFEKYPDLTEVIINITVDRPVTKHNADRVNNKTYTWILSKNNSNKGITLILDNSEKNNNYLPSNSDANQNNTNKHDYTMYIFSGILLIVFLIGYAIYKKIIGKDDSID